jgi:bis(5'-nucleosyl)-tetraphosphatase (symmetrical)
MSTYAIGDVQGCFDELQKLLQLIEFDAETDRLWFVGDLVNRGPKSLEVLRFVKNLPNPVVVLGNHDLHLLTVFNCPNHLHGEHSLQDVLQAPDRYELIDWLRTRLFLHHDERLGYVMVHAGIYPNWTLLQAKSYANEIEKIFRSKNYPDYLEHMYSDEPNMWHDSLAGMERFRFIVNCFTRMRFCDKRGRLNLLETGDPVSAPPGYMPWFKVPNRKTKQYKIIFGHWAALQGKANTANIYALDTGCVWGGALTALRLEDERVFSVASGFCAA